MSRARSLAAFAAVACALGACAGTTPSSQTVLGGASQPMADAVDGEGDEAAAEPELPPRDPALDAAHLLAGRDPAAAALAFERLALANPESCEAWVNAGTLQERLGDGARATELYRKGVAASARCSDGYAALAWQALRRGDFERAQSLARDGLRARPTHVPLRNRLAEARYGLGALDDALKAALDVLQLDEKNADAQLTISRVFFAQKKLELARLAANNAFEVAPNRADVHHQLGMLYLAKDERPKALAEFRRAVELEPTLLPSQVNLAQLLTEAGDFEGALSAARSAVKADPQGRSATLALANALRSNQRYREAEESYQLLLSRNAADVDVLYNLAMLYLDAELPGIDLGERLQRAINTFEALVAQPSLAEAERQAARGFIAAAKRQQEAEKKRLEREEKRKAKKAASQPASTQAAP